MRRRLVGIWALVAAAVGAPIAGADSWPVAGGDASRSGARFADAGEAPVTHAWTAGAVGVRTPILISAGGGPSAQRVAYGTSSGRLHIRVLETGKAVTPPEGLVVNVGAIQGEPEMFGEGRGAIGLLDTSTADKLGLLLVLHNDEGAIYLTRVDLATGAIVGDQTPIPGSLGCSTNSSPLVTPPDSAGGRILYFTMVGPCLGNTSLVRVPLHSALTEARAGDVSYTAEPQLAELASPSLFVLRDPNGAPRYHVAVSRTAGINFYDAGRALDPATPPADLAPEITAELPDATELPQTPAAAATRTGAVAGGGGTGTSQAPAIYVASDVGGQTRVHRLVQDGSARRLRLAATTASLPNAGAPAPAMAVAETVERSGGTHGHLIVASAGNVTILRSSDLTITGQLSSTLLPAGQGFDATVPAVSGSLVYLQRSGSTTVVPEHIVLRIPTATRLGGTDFGPAPNNPAGNAFGQPAIARGFVLLGGPGGTYAYRNRDVTDPEVELPRHPVTLSGVADLLADARDARGIDRVSWRLVQGQTTRTVAAVSSPASGSPFVETARYVGAFATASMPNGDYLLEAVASDTAGNTSVTARRAVRIANEGGQHGLPKGACARTLEGTSRPDRLTGSPAGDRIVGGGGDDRLDGAGGHDCVLGQQGDDVVAGSRGDDLLHGGIGDDTMVGGPGSNRLEGGRGADVIRGGRNSDRVAGGTGSDTVLAGKGSDRVAGGAGNDSLRGEAGNDRLYGGPGADSIVAGSGVNRISGGSGNDRVSAVNGKVDTIACGRGRDRVVADYRDRVRRDCERITRRAFRR